MEESELNPDDQDQQETSSIGNNDELKVNEQNEDILINDSSINNDQKIELNKQKKLNKENSLFKRILENGFDGVTTNPNYKLLALLIILLINLSLFFLVGNLGKSFLKNSGILG